LAVYTPLGITVLLVVWAVLVSPHSKYGDSWAIVPALLTLPLVVGVHVVLAYKAQSRKDFVAYALLHCALFFLIWIYCLMAISKDSL
jgi:uncharacterized membrane protein